MAIYNPDSNAHSDGSDSIAYEPQYFDVHVFFDRKNGYSFPVKIVSDRTLFEDEVIDYCIENNLFREEGDHDYVDYVEEIDLSIYKQMKGV